MGEDRTVVDRVGVHCFCTIRTCQKTMYALCTVKNRLYRMKQVIEIVQTTENGTKLLEIKPSSTLQCLLAYSLLT